ncbi:hypothetical protein [Peribacillus simplex]|uniref:hypothetical protein n=1 Tax=Peribacillus simplex TaxID=1478 RepID=UPI003D2D0BAF
MKEIYNLCVQGSVIEAYQYLRNLKNKTEEQRHLEKKYYQRFFKKFTESEMKISDSWIQHVLNAYNNYFVNVLTNKKSHDIAEKILLNNLNDILPPRFKSVDLESAENGLKGVFEQKGYHFLGGKTLPYYGPYIWKEMSLKTYKVKLPNSTEIIKVFFMDEFLMLSWLHFATFGNLYTGGWANDTGLYCVKEAYSDVLDSPEFYVSFLKHEAQHYSDYRDFPNLKSKDLEYRAKLIELIYYPNSDVFQKIVQEAVKGSSNPHSYSSYVIVNQFSNQFFKRKFENYMGEWKKIEYKELRLFAKHLYDEHTVKLKRKGASQVEEVI